MMKRILLLAALLCFAGNSLAQNDIVEKRIIGFKQNADKGISLRLYPLYAPGLSVDGEKKEWGVGIAATFPLNDLSPLAESSMAQHLFAGLRGDFLADKFFASSVAGGFKANIQIFGLDFKATGFGGALIPLSGAESLNNKLGAIVGAELSTKLFSFGKADADGNKPGSFGIAFATERWTLYPQDLIYRGGGVLTWKF